VAALSPDSRARPASQVLPDIETIISREEQCGTRRDPPPCHQFLFALIVMSSGLPSRRTAEAVSTSILAVPGKSFEAARIFVRWMMNRSLHENRMGISVPQNEEEAQTVAKGCTTIVSNTMTRPPRPTQS
jgi:hypothetical protein